MTQTAEAAVVDDLFVTGKRKKKEKVKAVNVVCITQYGKTRLILNSTLVAGGKFKIERRRSERRKERKKVRPTQHSTKQSKDIASIQDWHG